MTQLPGLFITGTDTNVGKTYVAAQIARHLTTTGVRVGVYKPVASGCRNEAGRLVSDDAEQLWEAAGRPGSLDDVCPQRFAASLAPNVAARAEGRVVDDLLLRQGLETWREWSDLVLVEGAGGWLSPLSEQSLTADLAREFGLPIVVVALNALGTINHTLLTLRAVRDAGLNIAAVVLNDSAADLDCSAATNQAELARWIAAPITRLFKDGQGCVPSVDWLAAAQQARLT